MDTSVESLVGRAERYAEAKGLALSTVSFHIFNDGKRLKALKSGAGITVKRLRIGSERLAQLERESASPVESAA